MGDTTIYMDKSMLDTIEKRIRIEFKVVEHYNKELKKLPVEYVIKMGFVVADILEMIEEHTIDIIVMGTKGTGNKSKNIFGSTAVDMIQKTTCPVLVIPEGVKNLNIRKIAFASDFHTDNIETPLQLTKLLVDKYAAEVKIIHVGKDEMLCDHIKERNETLAKFEDELKESKNITCDYVNKLDVATGIAEYVKSERIDLIILTPHRYDFFEKLFKESITRKLTLHSEIPLLAIPE
jgi:nucleotide-binding universal stress UspA family protein